LALQVQLVNAQQAAVENQKAMDNARRDFSSELEKLRETLKLTEERYLATESRALLEIDRERTITAKIQKELKQVRSSATEAADRHRAGIQILQNEIGNLKQRNGNIEGELRAVSISKDILTTELIQERESVLDLSARLTTATNETEVWRQKASDVQLSLDTLRQPKQRKSRRHQGTE
jgi:chromosome segregation ATPase